jgi:hypothetical protein
MTPRKGDKVRVTYEAVYAGPDELGHRIDWCPSLPCPPEVIRQHIPADATIEVIEDLRDGDVYLDANDHAVMYRHKSNSERPWFCLTHLEWHKDDLVTRPLSLIVRDRKRVV